MEASSKPLILYAEDDQDDYESLLDAISQITDMYQVVQAKNGADAVAYLEDNATPAPCLIVIDLNMPVMDGKELLQWLKSREQFRDIPIMVFTTSSREEDVKLCQKYSCTFFRKPTLYRDLLHIAKAMLDLCDSSR